MLLTGEGPLTCDWQPLWRRAGLCEGQLSRLPHSHWSRVTHKRQANHLSFISSLCLPVFWFPFTYSFYASRRYFAKFPELVFLPSPHYLGFSSWCKCFFLLFDVFPHYLFLRNIFFLFVTPSASCAPRLTFFLPSQSLSLPPTFFMATAPFFLAYTWVIFSPSRLPLLFLSSATLLNCPRRSVTSFTS